MSFYFIFFIYLPLLIRLVIYLFTYHQETREKKKRTVFPPGFLVLFHCYCVWVMKRGPALAISYIYLF